MRLKFKINIIFLFYLLIYFYKKEYFHLFDSVQFCISERQHILLKKIKNGGTAGNQSDTQKFGV